MSAAQELIAAIPRCGCILIGPVASPSILTLGFAVCPYYWFAGGSALQSSGYLGLRWSWLVVMLPGAWVSGSARTAAYPGLRVRRGSPRTIQHHLAAQTPTLRSTCDPLARAGVVQLDIPNDH